MDSNNYLSHLFILRAHAKKSIGKKRNKSYTSFSPVTELNYI